MTAIDPVVTQPTVTQIDEDTFVREYQPKIAPGTDPAYGMFQWNFAQIHGQPEKHVWALVDGDEDNNQYAIPGYHRNNGAGYLVTTKAWPHEHIEVLWFEIEDDEQDEHG